MTIMDRVRLRLVKLLFPVVRAFLAHAPLFVLIWFFRALRWVGYLVTGEPMLRMALTDVIAILEGGPPFSDTFKKLVGGSETEVVASIFKSMRKSSPYGAM